MDYKRLFHRVNYTIFFLKQYLFDNRFKELRKIRILDNITTINHIVENKVSMSRFGDGEIKLLSGESTDFQTYNIEIGEKLREIIISNSENHIVGLPHPWLSLFQLKYDAFEYWSAYLSKNLETKILPNIDTSKTYYDTNFTRFYIDYPSYKNAKKTIPLIKQIWEGQDICFIEGEYSRLGVGNDLFNNSKSISRIICPARNAFQVYQSIIEKACKLPKTTLILIALGMTATCLAYDLCSLGYWAIDIGHIDIEYEWYKMNAKKKVSIPNKYVAESGKLFVDTLQDKTYESQIIDKILY